MLYCRLWGHYLKYIEHFIGKKGSIFSKKKKEKIISFNFYFPTWSVLWHWQKQKGNRCGCLLWPGHPDWSLAIFSRKAFEELLVPKPCLRLSKWLCSLRHVLHDSWRNCATGWPVVCPRQNVCASFWLSKSCVFPGRVIYLFQRKNPLGGEKWQGRYFSEWMNEWMNRRNGITYKCTQLRSVCVYLGITSPKGRL